MKFWQPISWAETEQLCEIAQFAQECGFEGLMGADHALYPQTMAPDYPYSDNGFPPQTAEHEYPDMWTSFGAMAAVTSKIKLVCGVYVLPIRNPIEVAKQAATLAILSQGRFALGAGTGWMKEEFDAYDVPFKGRGKRMDEMLEIMRLLWTGEMVEYQGKHYQFGPMEMNPAPSAPVPVWIGGISDPAMKRAARLADGWVTDLQTSEEIIGCIEQIREWRREYGRAEQPFEVMATPSDAWDVDGYRRLEEAGVTHILTMPWPFYHGDSQALEHKIDGIRRFADDVIGHFD